MSIEKFSGKAEIYAKARPSYPDAAIDYIASLIQENAVIADIGAGTGKFAELLSKRKYRLVAVEPNADMRKQLVKALSPYANAAVLDGTAENTSLPDKSVDVITCAQALHWFDPEAFRAECRRIAKNEALVIAVYNNTPGGSSIRNSKISTDAFFVSPIVREFPNPIKYTRESWLDYMSSHSHDPLPTDSGYKAHIAEMNEIFDKEQLGGFLIKEVVTKVYSGIA